MALSRFLDLWIVGKVGMLRKESGQLSLADG